MSSQIGVATGLALWTAILSAALVAALCVTLSGASTAVAAAGPEQEVDALLARLERSPCSFRRNDQWHDGATASAHLRRKWRMGAFGRAPSSAEQFVEMAGSRSHESGAPYGVRCPGESEQPAGPWLQRHLEQLRRGSSLGPLDPWVPLGPWRMSFAQPQAMAAHKQSINLSVREIRGALAPRTLNPVQAT